MKAYTYLDRIALDALVPVDHPDPSPGPHQIVLRMRAAALNFRDLAIVRGDYHVATRPPLVPLSDGAGEVVAIGSEVTRFRIGDLACPVYLPDWLDGPLRPAYGLRRLGGPSDGVLAEAICLHEDEAVRAPAHLDAVEAATLPVAPVTAWHALYAAAALAPGDTVLVQGTGGVALAALQLACAGGAQALVLTRSDHATARLRALGASAVLPLGETPDWPAAVRACTRGRGVDVAIETVGGASLARTVTALRVGGRVHLVGYVAGQAAGFDTFDAIRHALTLHVATAGSRESFERMNRAIEQHRIRPVVEHVYPLARIADAFGHLARGGHFGKVVVQLS